MTQNQKAPQLFRTLIKVKVQPKASQDQVLGFQSDVLRVRVTTAPERGKANQAVIELLAQFLDVPKGWIRIQRGHGSRDKWVEITGVSTEYIERVLTSNGR